MRVKQPDFMWAYFGQFGTAMWARRKESLEFDFDVWRAMTDRMAKNGLNVLVMDLGEGLAYPSHPELAVKGSWTPERMRDEIVRLKSMGILAIPKLNFSTCHDAWLGDYARMVSTPTYYAVCADLIGDVSRIFDEAPLLHLGYDEEEWLDQEPYDHVVIRQGELWWHDFLWFAEETRKAGFRPWAWADPVWFMKDEYLTRMPKDVLQSNWYYFTTFNERAGDVSPKGRPAQAPYYKVLSDAGFEQVPCSSNYRVNENCALTALHCRHVIRPDLLRGFLHAPWCPTVVENRARILAGVSQLAAVKHAVE